MEVKYTKIKDYVVK
jgi:hypothetical protein